MEYIFQENIRVRNNGTAPASWWFITIPKDISNDIKDFSLEKPRRWWWSIKVKVMIGFIKRETSIFPDKKSWCYLLPIKATIRKELQIKEWAKLYITITISE